MNTDIKTTAKRQSKKNDSASKENLWKETSWGEELTESDLQVICGGMTRELPGNSW